jgi:ABC-2 type transport system permease protein
MWLPVWRHDWRELCRSGRLPCVAAVLTVLVVLASLAGAGWIEFQRRAVEQIIAGGEDQYGAYVRESAAWLERHGTVERGAPQTPISVYWKRAYAWLAPKPEGILAVGQSDVRPYYTVFHGVDRQILHFATEIQNPLHLLVGKLDLAFVAVYLLPLLVIALAYDVVSGDRDAGRLSLMRVQARSVAGVIVARLGLRMGLLTLAFAGLVLVALAVVEPAAVSGDTIQFLVLSAAWVAGWFALALAVNTTRAPAWLCGLLLTGCWVLLVFLAPTLLHAASERRHPLPSRTQQVMAAAAFRQAVDSSRPDQVARLLRERPDLGASGDPARPGATPEWYPAFIAYQIALEREDARDEARFAHVLDARERMAVRWRMLVPSIVLQRAAQRAAGTSTGDFRDFADRTEAFRARRLEYTRGFLFRDEWLTADELAAIPLFTPAEPGDRSSPWADTLRDAGWLATLAAVLLFTGWRRLDGQ